MGKVHTEHILAMATKIRFTRCHKLGMSHIEWASNLPPHIILLRHTGATMIKATENHRDTDSVSRCERRITYKHRDDGWKSWSWNTGHSLTNLVWVWVFTYCGYYDCNTIHALFQIPCFPIVVSKKCRVISQLIVLIIFKFPRCLLFVSYILSECMVELIIIG